MGGMREGVVGSGFDPRALSAEPDAVALRRFRRARERAEREGGVPRGRGLVADTVIRVTVAALLLAVVAAIVGWLPSVPTASPGGIVFGILFLGLVGIGGALFLLAPLRRRFGGTRPWRRWFRLDAFATDNGLRYEPATAVLPRGSMFGQGKNRRILDSFTGIDDRFQMGTFAFEAENGPSYGASGYGFLRITLPRPVPHLVLVSVASRGLQGYSAVGLAFHESQRVRLEGDFDRFFAVYAPGGYGADARYVLTPDFMARLADHAARYDLEFVDDQFFVYSGVAWDFEKIATWTWARWFAEAVGVTALRRTARFTDDRSDAPGREVAHRGRRLRVGIPAAAVLLTLGWIVVQVVRVLLQTAT